MIMMRKDEEDNEEKRWSRWGKMWIRADCRHLAVRPFPLTRDDPPVVHTNCPNPIFTKDTFPSSSSSWMSRNVVKKTKQMFCLSGTSRQKWTLSLLRLDGISTSDSNMIQIHRLWRWFKSSQLCKYGMTLQSPFVNIVLKSFGSTNCSMMM